MMFNAVIYFEKVTVVEDGGGRRCDREWSWKWTRPSSKPPELSFFRKDALDSSYMVGRSSLASVPFSTLSTSNRWEHKLQTSHFPEMVFGDSSLVLKHVSSGIKIHFNTFDALTAWKQEALPPVEVPAAAKWKFRSQPFQQLDYDYTFTTPYCGSQTIEINEELARGATSEDNNCGLYWEDCKEQIDLAALASKEPILFYDEVILYEDELADSGVSLLTVKVVNSRLSQLYVARMDTIRFLHKLRVDGVLMRLRDTRMHCVFANSATPIILRESCWREATFKALSAKGYPSDSAAYNDPSIISQRLPIIMHKSQKLKIPVIISFVVWKQKQGLGALKLSDKWAVARVQ
ncbi:unnamed protein product [Camellia sinensis]